MGRGLKIVGALILTWIILALIAFFFDFSYFFEGFQWLGYVMYAVFIAALFFIWRYALKSHAKDKAQARKESNKYGLNKKQKIIVNILAVVGIIVGWIFGTWLGLLLGGFGVALMTVGYFQGQNGEKGLKNIIIGTILIVLLVLWAGYMYSSVTQDLTLMDSQCNDHCWNEYGEESNYQYYYTELISNDEYKCYCLNQYNQTIGGSGDILETSWS